MRKKRKPAIVDVADYVEPTHNRRAITSAVERKQFEGTATKV
jgi:hypothetical protein